MAMLGSVVLLMVGAFYAWYGLIPLLLDYLTTDAQQAGLSTEWRLSNYAGFIVNLVSASAIGFQAPLITTLLLRSGAVSRDQFVASRRVIWFGAFVLGAFMSPPDPLSLFLVAMPIILLFEAAMAVDRFMRRSV
jgi:sec-independent protein translocase protein TatC